MPLRPPAQIPSQVKNGLGLYVQPCSSIVLRYCNWGGSSRGMRDLLRTQLRSVAQQHPEIEFRVKQESGHPILQGFYPNGRVKSICVRNFDAAKIAKKIELLKNSSGAKLEKYKRAVESTNESVRGIWSPFHVAKDKRHRI